jgi:hypothetical protein
MTVWSDTNPAMALTVSGSNSRRPVKCCNTRHHLSSAIACSTVMRWDDWLLRSASAARELGHPRVGLHAEHLAAGRLELPGFNAGAAADVQAAALRLAVGFGSLLFGLDGCGKLGDRFRAA